MNRNEILDIVLEIFESIFEDVPTTSLASIQKQTTPSWDSMKQVNLVAALEGEFDVVIELSDATELANVDDCVALIETLI